MCVDEKILVKTKYAGRLVGVAEKPCVNKALLLFLAKIENNFH